MTNVNFMLLLLLLPLLLLLLLIENASAQHDHDHDHADSGHDDHDHDDPIPSTTSAWVVAIGMSILISLSSLVALLILGTCKNATKSHHTLFVGLGAGSMLATSLLVLMPESHEVLELPLASQLMLGGVLFGMSVEIFIDFVGGHNHSKRDELHSRSWPAEESVTPRDGSKVKAPVDDNSTVYTLSIASSMPLDSTANSVKRNNSLAWNNIIGDGIHNFIDGMLLGVIFLHSIRSGLLVCLATICHEIPQEIGDYFILIHAGWTSRKSLIMNLASASLAIIGTIVGLTVGNSLGVNVGYLLPVVAGQFLYIALVQLLPPYLALDDKRTQAMAFIAFFFGIAMIWVVSMIEIPGAEHSHSHAG